MTLCENFNSLKDSHMVKLIMAIMFGWLFRVVAKTFTVWWICPIKCLYALMFLDIPSQVLICPHVCPYAPLPNNGMWCKYGHPSDIGNLYVIIGISTLLASLMTIPRSRQGTQVFDHSTYTLITVSNTSHARRWWNVSESPLRVPYW